MDSKVLFKESTARHGIESLPFSHLSIELGHLYAEDFGPANRNLDRYFERIAPWVRCARESCQAGLPRGVKPRISTCFLVDDYFNRFGSPPEVIRVLDSSARKHGMTIDYLAREAACANADGVELARLVSHRIVTDPTPETTGGRPPAHESGWLCNGRRSPIPGVAPAMKASVAWAPPAENGSNLHSIFVDVQMWSESAGKRTWSCSFLASVWQLIRLGQLRHSGAAAVRPFQMDPDATIPDDWDRLPAVLQLNPDATPFTAYRTMSVLQSRFLTVEHAVRTILSQVSVDRTVVEQIAKRSHDEGIDLPEELIDRIGYFFVSG